MSARPSQPHEPTPVDRYALRRGRDLPKSTLPDDPMKKIWQNADDRETGAEAVEAIRARRRNLGSQDALRKNH
jgi:hypothetical protein